MQFLIPTLALLTATQAALIPRSQLGSWALTLAQSDSGYAVTANYTSDSYPAGIVSSCVTEQEACRDRSFAFRIEGNVVQLSQGLMLPSQMTVFGDKEFEGAGEITVAVTRAIA